MRRLIPFNPSAEQLHQVLDEIVSPYASLDDVASNNGTTVLALSAWLALSETQAMLDQIEQAAYRRARVSAACNLTDAVNSLSFTLRAHVSAESNEPLGRTTDALNIRQRQRTDARKASWLLFRIARAYPAIPVDPSTLRFANTLKRERDDFREHGEFQGLSDDATSPVPSRSVADFDVSHTTSRVARLHELQARASPAPEVIHGSANTAMQPDTSSPHPSPPSTTLCLDGDSSSSSPPSSPRSAALAADTVVPAPSRSTPLARDGP